MLFDVRKGNTVNPYITIAEALKEGTDEFSNQVEAIQFIRQNDIKPYFVDAKMVELYLASDLGVFYNKDEETK